MGLFRHNDKAPICGGNDTYIDRNAKKAIESDDMVFFNVTSALNTYALRDKNALGFVSAFASKSPDGCFVFLETESAFRDSEDRYRKWSVVGNDIFKELTEIVSRYNVAKDNGYHSTTHGLPENFGGDIDIRYSSGEKISISDNQSPIVSIELANEIAGVFKKAIAGNKFRHPKLDQLKEISFSEERKDNGYTRVRLVMNPDGSANTSYSSRYSGPEVYNKEKVIEQSKVEKIKKTIEECGLLFWSMLPESKYKFSNTKTLTFVINDTEYTTDDFREVPVQLNRGFFDIELELTK